MVLSFHLGQFFPCIGEDWLQHDGVLVDEAAILVVLLSIGAQQHEVFLQGVEIIVLNVRQGLIKNRSSHNCINPLDDNFQIWYKITIWCKDETQEKK